MLVPYCIVQLLEGQHYVYVISILKCRPWAEQHFCQIRNVPLVEGTNFILSFLQLYSHSPKSVMYIDAASVVDVSHLC